MKDVYRGGLGPDEQSVDGSGGPPFSPNHQGKTASPGHVIGEPATSPAASSDSGENYGTFVTNLVDVNAD